MNTRKHNIQETKQEHFQMNTLIENIFGLSGVLSNSLAQRLVLGIMVALRVDPFALFLILLRHDRKYNNK